MPHVHNHDLDEHDDDKPVGRILSRREVMKLLGGASAVMLVSTQLGKVGLSQLTGTVTPTPTAATTATATAVPACVVRPELTEGPYFVDGVLNRSDIRIDPSDESVKEGVELRLRFQVSDVSADSCAPLAGAQVDVWHCDALGVYSGVSDPGFDTSDQIWLRGYQVTDEKGLAEFITIYPGWYQGRATHIHFKIRTEPESEQGYEFTSQFFFDEELTDLVHAESPYVEKGYRTILNEDDNIFQSSDGLLTLEVVEVEDEDGVYIATFDIGLDLTAPTQAETGSDPFGGQGGGQGGRPGGGTPPNGTPSAPPGSNG